MGLFVNLLQAVQDGNIMVVQTLQNNETTINYVQIPKKIPKEIIENDSLMVLEKSLNKLESRVMITAQTVLGINTELKTQIIEIDRIEKTILNMHEYIIQQHDKIENLEHQMQNLKKNQKSINNEFEQKTGFWRKIFTK